MTPTDFQHVLDTLNGEQELLWLSENFLGDEGLAFLKQRAMKMARVKLMDLRSNSIADPGMEALGHLAKQGSLHTLYLKRNCVTDEGIRLFRSVVIQSPESCALKVLGLENNNLSNAGVTMLIEMARALPNLTRVDITGNDQIDGALSTELGFMLRVKQTLWFKTILLLVAGRKMPRVSAGASVLARLPMDLIEMVAKAYGPI